MRMIAKSRGGAGGPGGKAIVPRIANLSDFVGTIVGSSA
jgi:hypothetical protein